MNVRWSHCVLKVRHLDAMVTFYCEALGFVVADRGAIGPDQSLAFLSGNSSDHHQLGLLEGRGDDDRIGDGLPVTHGNAVSVYFKDPEGNGIEIFCDTPWHVPQPQLKGWEPSTSAEEVLASVEAKFASEPGFTPMAEYRSAQAKAFGE